MRQLLPQEICQPAGGRHDFNYSDGDDTLVLTLYATDRYPMLGYRIAATPDADTPYAVMIYPQGPGVAFSWPANSYADATRRLKEFVASPQFTDHFGTFTGAGIPPSR